MCAFQRSAGLVVIPRVARTGDLPAARLNMTPCDVQTKMGRVMSPGEARFTNMGGVTYFWGRRRSPPHVSD